MLTLQTSKAFCLSATSRSCRPFLCPSFITYLFQISTIVLSNAMGLCSGYRMSWSFFESSENLGPVIINTTKYGIAQLSTALSPGLDLNLVRRGTPVLIVWGISLAFSSSSSPLLFSTRWCTFCQGFLGQLAHFFTAVEFLLIVIGRASCCL